MKKFYAAIILLSLLVPASFSQNKSVIKNAEGSSFFKNDKAKGLRSLESGLGRKLIVEWNKNNSTPARVAGGLTEKGYASPQDMSSSGVRFLNENKELFGLQNPYEEMKVLSVKTDKLKMTHVKYQQHLNGIKILPGQLIIHFNNDGSIKSINGKYYPTPVINTIPSLSSEAAIQLAEKKLAGYKTESKSAELNLYEKDGSLILVYAVSLPSFSNPKMMVYVNAATGETVKVDDGIRYDGPEVGSGTGLDDQQVTVNSYFSSGKYILLDASLEMFNPPLDTINNTGFVATLDALNDTSESGFDLIEIVTDPNNDNNFNDNERLKAAVTAHGLSSDVYEFFRIYFSRNSFDDNGKSIISVVHYKENFNNAFWNGTFLTYGDGDGVIFSNLAAGYDVVVHELTHAVTTSTANLNYELEPGAINESMSDVFAVLADSTDWLIGEDIFTPSFPGDGLRSMQDPHNNKTFGDIASGWQPAHMDEFVELLNDEEHDWGGVHVNSGIPNKAFYNAATAIGRWKSGQIWYRALTEYLTNYSGFSDLRNACISSAEDLHGEGSGEADAVADAFDAVGIAASDETAVELIYDDNSPTWGYVILDANAELALKFTNTIGSSEVTNVKIYYVSDNAGGTGHFYLKMYSENPVTGYPGESLIDPFSYIPDTQGWQSFNLTDVFVDGDFYVGIAYDGINEPMIGADEPGNGRSWGFNNSSQWFQIGYSLFIRATLKTATGVVVTDTRIPENFELLQNYPNPFNPSTTIRYSLPKETNTEIIIYDITGNEVAVLLNDLQNPGTYEITWNGMSSSGQHVSSGVYFCSFRAGVFTKTMKMLLLK